MKTAFAALLAFAFFQDANAQSLQKALAKIAEEASQETPKTVDSETRLDSISAGPGYVFMYVYTLTNASSSTFDRKLFFRMQTGLVKKGLCSYPKMEWFFQNGVTIKYMYRAADGSYLGEIDTTPKDCGYTLKGADVGQPLSRQRQ